MSALKIYEVGISTFPPLTFSAVSPSQARAAAWRSYCGVYECTFKDFLKISSVRRCGVPANDGYGYVRRHYGVDPKIGSRVRLVNEGRSSGLEGEVAYPGESTAHVHVLIDGHKHITTVHPLSIEFIT